MLFNIVLHSHAIPWAPQVLSAQLDDDCRYVAESEEKYGHQRRRRF